MLDIIDNNIEKVDNIHDIIINYFENYLNSNIKIIIPSFIDEYLWFNNNEFNNSLIKNIKELINKRNNMRELIKKNNFKINGLIILINDFFDKIKYIDIIIKNHNIINYSINQLNDLILSDNNLILLLTNKIKLNYIENDNDNLLNDLKKLFIIISELSHYDLIIINNFYNILNNIISNNMNYIELPLTNNLILINNINDIFKYLNFYYNFLYSIIFILIDNDIDNKINNILLNKKILKILDLTINKLLDLFIEIFKINNFHEIKFIFDNYSSEINKFIIYCENNNNKYNLLYQEMITFVFKLKINNNILNIHEYTGNCLDVLILINKIDKLIFINIYHNILKQSYNEILTNDINLNMEYLNYIINNYINIENIDIQYNLHLYDIKLCINNIIEYLYSKYDIIDINNKYYELLLKRLMYNFINYNNNINYYNNEKYIVNCILLYNINIKKYLYKINKILNDFDNSVKNNLLFNNNKLNILTISYNCWDINQNEGLIDFNILKNNINSNLCKELLEYDIFYKIQNNCKKNIYWFPHFGSIDITFNNKNIKLLPIQFMILELFDNNIQNNYDDIINNFIFTNYSKKFKDDILSSLIISKLLINNNKILSITTNDDFETDLINIFFTTSDYAIIWEEKRQLEFISEKEDIIKTNINELVKQLKLNKIELFNKLKDKIKLFDINMEQYEKCLNYMIKFNYINIVDDIIYKICY